MLSFEEAGRILDEACEALPPGLFRDLNGGVSLLPGERKGEDGRYILGLYHNDMMGRWIELFYGSFRRVYAGAEEDEVARALRETLHHELTHHVEGLAGDRTLEKQDQREREEYRLAQEQARFGGGYAGPGKSSRMRRRARPARPYEEDGP